MLLEAAGEVDFGAEIGGFSMGRLQNLGGGWQGGWEQAAGGCW